MNILFASMHGAAAKEISLLSAGAGHSIFFPIKGNGVIRTATIIGDVKTIEQYGGHAITEDQEILDKWSDGFFDCIIVSTPEQVTGYKKKLRKIKNLPLIVRHGMNSFDKFKSVGLKNFISPSQRAINIMSDCHCFRNRKLVKWDSFPEIKPASERRDFHSYIHYYEKHWGSEYRIFQNLRRYLKKKDISLENYGLGTENGLIDDVSQMNKSRGTIHIKGGQVGCNSVIKSLCLGTPVVLDPNTVNNCFLDQIVGLSVRKDSRKIYKEMRLLQDDDYWNECSRKAREVAEEQFTFTQELGVSYTEFLGKLRK